MHLVLLLLAACSHPEPAKPPPAPLDPPEAPFTLQSWTPPPRAGTLVKTETQGGATVETHLIDGWRLLLTLPPGTPAAHSLPAVIAPPSGTNLLSGGAVRDVERSELLRYAAGGVAVLSYDLPGALELPEDGEVTADEMASAYTGFRADQAGLASTSRALDWLLANVDAVDPHRVFIAGAGSAGTLALLFCAHQPTLAGCVAYGPTVDLVSHWGVDGLSSLEQAGLVGALAFARQASPIRQVSRIQPPVLLFTSPEDSTEVEGVDHFADALTRLGHVPTRIVSSDADAENPVLTDGIPAALAWMARLH